MIESTLVLIKPDGLQKSLTGNILTRLAETKLEIVAVKMVTVTRDLAEAHYKDLQNEPFFERVITYMCGEQNEGKKVMALVYEGEDAIAKVRAVVGATNPEEAEPTTIRGSYGRITTTGEFENVVHASSSVEDAEREIKIWFHIAIDNSPSFL